jgi:hypothetical protein
LWGALMIAGLAAAAAINGLRRFRNEEMFGLRLVYESRELTSYDGELDGARVRVDRRVEGWTVTLSADCASKAGLFAHMPSASFDRPIAALVGSQGRLDRPAAYGASWTFYGTPTAVVFARRLPAPGPAWTTLELAGGSFEVVLKFRGTPSNKKLRLEIAAFRKALALILA